MFKTTTGLAAATGILCLATPAQGSPPADTACPPEPSGYMRWAVSTEPYRVDNLTDELGNGDGWVCARPGKVVADEDGNPFQLYNFIDNRVAAG